MVDNNEGLSDSLSGMVMDGMISGQGADEWYLKGRVKRLILDLQKHWLEDYRSSRESALVDTVTKIHQKFLIDQKKAQEDLIAQFKLELDTTRDQLERKHQEAVDVEIQRVLERNQAEMQNCKKKQWCFQCDAEAIYHCCWNTSYCSTECQQGHWPVHRRQCRRRNNNRNN